MSDNPPVLISLVPTLLSPGEVLSGEVRISFPKPWKPDYAELVLLWRSVRKLDSTLITGEIAERLVLFREGEVAPVSSTHPFSFPVPKMPWSYDGKLVRLEWVLGVYVRPLEQKEYYSEVILHIAECKVEA